MLSKKSIYHRYFIELAYLGTSFHGWQIQPNAPTIQEELNHAVSTLLGAPVNLVGAGRTDAGVHASHFVAHFDWDQEEIDPGELTLRLNRMVPESIRIDRIVEVDPETHSRFSATSRTYHYLIRTERNPFLKDYSWMIQKPLDLAAMNRAAGYLLDYSDFTSFARLHADNKTNICKLEKAVWVSKGTFLLFEIKADRFLRNMVRAIVGTLIQVGVGKLSDAEFTKIIQDQDRSAAGQSAPAAGLFLSRIEYPPELFRTNPKAPFPDLF